MGWWKQAVFYEIYIRSFQDSSDDGVGDLNGIARRLDYLADLGVDAIWITPFYPSPQVDFGYDISNHEEVDRRFGTLADFDALIAAAHARNIKVVIDIVLNHLSDRHPWFLDSRSSRSSAYRDWFVWRDGRAPGEPPNNWESAFGGPAWTFDERTGQWYYHFFYAAQPDLNWRHPMVEARMFETLAFWIGHGVDGFRLDAVNTLFEDPDLQDNPQLSEPKVTLTGVRTQDFVNTRRLPELHDVLQRLRRYVDGRARDVVLISEAYVDEIDELVRFYGDNDDEMHLPFNFFLTQAPALHAAFIEQAVNDVEAAFGGRWPSLVFSNHDIDRACDRYASGFDVDAVAKLLAMLLLTLRGTPFIYYGEEIAMQTYPPERIEDVQDPVGRTFWPRYKGRDGARRPMQWSGDPGSGFTGGVPWLGFAPDAHTRTVAAQRDNPASVLNFYRRLLRVRREREALRTGTYRTLRSNPRVIAYARHASSETAVVILNPTAEPIAANVPPGEPLAARRWRVLLGTHRAPGEEIALRELRLNPFEALLLI